MPVRKRVRKTKAWRMGYRHWRWGAWRGSLVRRLCSPEHSAEYEAGYDKARIQAACRYPGTSNGRF